LESWQVPSFNPRQFQLADWINPAALLFCLLIGAASQPHMLVRSLTTPGVRATRESGAWSLLFFLLLSIVMTIYAALSNPDAGTQVFDLGASIAAVLTVAAMLATAKNLSLTIANALAHDILHKLLVPKATPGARLLMARLLLIVTAAFTEVAVVTQPAEVVPMTAWAFSIAAAGLFPALVLAVWWTRATAAGTITGMIAGAGVCLLYIVVTRYYPQIGVHYFAMSPLRNVADGQGSDIAQALADPRWLADMPASADNPLASHVGWFNIRNLGAGVFGLAAGLLTMIAVSLIGKAPPTPAIDALRSPRA
jgi:cation/acetate symporter